MSHGSPRDFRADVGRALHDTELRGALRLATGLFSERRQAALASVPDWQALRDQARRIKDTTLADLDQYLDQFVEQAQAAGVTIHRAADDSDACRIIAEIAQTAAFKPAIVKSKSMTTEEVGLNDYLEAQGLQPLETDLGEWIIQLADERPSHIIVPAIHKTRQQIARLFAEHLATDPDLDAAALTAVAREFLRERFAAADVGISGVNFAVAETGSILLLENEGNIRLTTSLPRVHIALMGIEKVIPRLADLAVFLRVLPRSGTGQHLTSYQSILTGPKRRPTDDGPEQMHIVLLDNGRRGMLASPVTRQSLACIRCGACLNACPVYQQIGGHAYGSVYPGPIGAIITPQLRGGEAAAALPFASSLCGACAEVCPVKIDIPELLLHLRAGARHSRWESLAFRSWARLHAGRGRYEFGAAVARLAQRLGILQRLPAVRAWRRQRELRPLAAQPFRARWQAGLVRSGPAEVRRVPPAPPPVAEIVAERDRGVQFAEMVRSVGGSCQLVADQAAAAAAVAEILRGLGDPAVACSDHPQLDALLPAGVERVAADAPRAALLRCGAGLSSAQFGIAETGTLVLLAAAERHRLVSLLPPVHIALVDRREIVADLDAALARIAADGPGQAVTFVTGPSRTADIELTLVVGVHGPSAIHVIVIG